ncbi:hypothetical protein IFM89_008326 [Coptis chinensis]|uniref:Epidermal patterning factor-like protein n=1 Tax=Coptis chinensis TaxID=261450 RepID=A0A835M4B1_9MAGN|nr:hypothetical protein IFM89_008326 [Coptis chinensis]
MASPRNFSDDGLGIMLLVVLILSFSFIPLKSVSSYLPNYAERQRKHVVGSKPPLCVNKCFSCNACIPTLVTHHPGQKKSSLNEDSNYYPVSWKCRCVKNISEP